MVPGELPFVLSSGTPRSIPLQAYILLSPVRMASRQPLIWHPDDNDIIDFLFRVVP